MYSSLKQILLHHKKKYMIYIVSQITFVNQRPNLKSLSSGLNMVGSTKNCITFFKIKAGAQLKPVFGGF